MLRRKDKNGEETANKSRSGIPPLRFTLLRAVGGRRRGMAWEAPRVAPGDRTHERRVCFKLRLHAARPAAHARGAERAPRIFRKGHDSPLLWMKLPPMVGTRRRFYKSGKLRKRGERGGGKRQRRRSGITYLNYTWDSPPVAPRLTRGPASLDSHTSRNLTTLDSASERGMTINRRFVYIGSVFQCGLWRLGRRLQPENRRSDMVRSVSPRRRLRRSGRRPQTENFWGEELKKML